MKKILLSFLNILFLSALSVSQTYTATLAIENVDISGIEEGEEFVVPIKLVDKSGGKIVGFQLFIEYDHTIITWKGSHQNPLPGIKNFHQNFPYAEDKWLFNDNGTFLAASWSDPVTEGLEIAGNENILEYIFTYNGGLKRKEALELVWGTTFEQVEGVVTRGSTELYSDLYDFYELILINGSIKK